MVDERKVRLMTRLSIFEKKETNRSLVISRYFRNDYVRYNVLKTWVAATVVYWSVVGAYVFNYFDDILAMINEIDYFDLMYKMLGWYAIFCVALCIVASFVYKFRYRKVKPGLIRYNSQLKDLIELQGGPARRGKKVAKGDERVVAPVAEPATQKANPNNRVNRSEIVKRQLEQQEREREQQIIENVQRRNARIAAQNEAAMARQQEAEAERLRIREQRQRLEQEQLAQLRADRNQYGYREEHTYQGFSGTDDRKEI